MKFNSFLLLVILQLISACGLGEFPTPEEDIDPEIWQEIQNVLQELSIRGVEAPNNRISKLLIVRKDSSQLLDKQVGLCVNRKRQNTAGKKSRWFEIYIAENNEYKLKTLGGVLNSFALEHILAHEIGHCIFDLPHQGQARTSIMANTTSHSMRSFIMGDANRRRIAYDNMAKEIKAFSVRSMDFSPDAERVEQKL